MDPIDVEPLNSAPPIAFVPYATSKDEVLATKRSYRRGALSWRIKKSKVRTLKIIQLERW